MSFLNSSPGDVDDEVYAHSFSARNHYTCPSIQWLIDWLTTLFLWSRSLVVAGRLCRVSARDNLLFSNYVSLSCNHCFHFPWNKFRGRAGRQFLVKFSVYYLSHIVPWFRATPILNYDTFDWQSPLRRALRLWQRGWWRAFGQMDF